MNRVTKRTWIMSLFILILLGGMLLFLGEYSLKASQWVISSGSPHLYNGTNVGFGTVVDRNGEMLLDISGSRTYSDDASTRKSTLHWLGDRNGSISASAVSNYSAAMAGFDLFNGIYNADGVGGSIQLTLSSKVQNAALAAMGDRKGTVAVYNYQTGEILCALTTPTFDPDHVPDIAGDETGKYSGIYVNRFLQSAYIPGSIFKTVTLSAVLETKPEIMDETFTCRGIVEYGTEAVTCERAHGKQDVKTAFANSCNCAFAQIAEKLGRKNMVSQVEAFGITEALEFDGVTTRKGNYDVSEAGKVSFAWSCIGQYNDLVNPARFMTFMGTIAGGGQAVEPHIVSRVESGGKPTYEAKPVKTDRIMSEETAQTIQKLLRNNVKTVYGDENFPGLKVCAKSGTSQLGGEETSNAMFAGFVENEEYPLAFMVVVENGGYGARTCVPILSKVLAACKDVLDGR